MGQVTHDTELVRTVRCLQRISRKLDRALVNMGRIASRYPYSCKRRVFAKWKNKVNELQRTYDQLWLDLTYSKMLPRK